MKGWQEWGRLRHRTARKNFAGSVTAYLKEVTLYTPEVISRIIQWQFIGAIIGGFF